MNEKIGCHPELCLQLKRIPAHVSNSVLSLGMIASRRNVACTGRGHGSSRHKSNTSSLQTSSPRFPATSIDEGKRPRVPGDCLRATHRFRPFCSSMGNVS